MLTDPNLSKYKYLSSSSLSEGKNDRKTGMNLSLRTRMKLEMMMNKKPVKMEKDCVPSANSGCNLDGWMDFKCFLKNLCK